MFGGKFHGKEDKTVEAKEEILPGLKDDTVHDWVTLRRRTVLTAGGSGHRIALICGRNRIMKGRN